MLSQIASAWLFNELVLFLAGQLLPMRGIGQNSLPNYLKALHRALSEVLVRGWLVDLRMGATYDQQ